MRVLVIHNAKAGGGTVSREELLGAFSASGLDVTYQAKSEMDLGAATAAEMIVVAGGDGTVAKVVTGLTDRSIPICIVPTGTANNIALSLGIGSVGEGISLLSSPRPKRFDIGRASWGEKSALFVEAAGFGPFITMLCSGVKHKAEEKLEEGRRALRDALTNAPLLPISVNIDDNAICGEPLLCEALNVRLAGPNIRLAPQASSSDGLLDVVWLSSDRRGAMLAWLDGPERVENPLRHQRAREMTIRGTGRFRLDDEACSLVEDATLTLRTEEQPACLLVPEDRDG